MTRYHCPYRHRLVDLSKTFHGRIKPSTLPGPGIGPELTEALKPRGIFEPYYEGGYRITLDGAPCRVAAHVKGWSARSRGKISSYLTPKEFSKVGEGITAAVMAAREALKQAA